MDSKLLHFLCMVVSSLLFEPPAKMCRRHGVSKRRQAVCRASLPPKNGAQAQILAYHTHCIHTFSPLFSPGLVILSESVDDHLPAHSRPFPVCWRRAGQLCDAHVTFLSLLWHRSHPDSVCMPKT